MLMKIVLVTGGTSGIGKATAAGMAAKDYMVVFLARNKEKADAVRREVIDSTGNEHVDYILADFT
jgi:NAD(P)-dependent dehydrogenase (short-subunit alcohol dehydrogenase family)